jgi:site-specific DNA-methyltransferase (adenine-specific)
MYELYLGDCLEQFQNVANNSIDLILCDLPYGTTACPWDSIIDLGDLWKQYKRVIKKNCPIVLTASQPFTTVLAMSNLEWFKYEWIWIKNRPTNFAHAKNKPMKKHENILVFSEGTTVHAVQSKNRMPYYPQGLVSIDEKKVTKNASELTDAFFQGRKSHGEFTRNQTGYPNSILEFSTDQLGLHPTAKPIALMEYLVCTYSQAGDTVLDNTMGCGTTGIACANTGRRFIGMEKDEKYFSIASTRIGESYTVETVAESSGMDDSDIFTFGG